MLNARVHLWADRDGFKVNELGAFQSVCGRTYTINARQMNH